MVNCLNKIFHWIYKKNSKNVPVLSLWNPPNPLNEIENFFRIDSVEFRLMRIQILEWIGINLIGSEWISIRNFHQGRYMNITKHWENASFRESFRTLYYSSSGKLDD